MRSFKGIITKLSAAFLCAAIVCLPFVTVDAEGMQQEAPSGETVFQNGDVVFENESVRMRYLGAEPVKTDLSFRIPSFSVENLTGGVFMIATSDQPDENGTQGEAMGTADIDSIGYFSFLSGPRRIMENETQNIYVTLFDANGYAFSAPESGILGVTFYFSGEGGSFDTGNIRVRLSGADESPTQSSESEAPDEGRVVFENEEVKLTLLGSRVDYDYYELPINALQFRLENKSEVRYYYNLEPFTEANEGIKNISDSQPILLDGVSCYAETSGWTYVENKSSMEFTMNFFDLIEGAIINFTPSANSAHEMLNGIFYFLSEDGKTSFNTGRLDIDISWLTADAGLSHHEPEPVFESESVRVSFAGVVQNSRNLDVVCFYIENLENCTYVVSASPIDEDQWYQNNPGNITLGDRIYTEKQVTPMNEVAPRSAVVYGFYIIDESGFNVVDIPRDGTTTALTMRFYFSNHMGHAFDTGDFTIELGK